MQGEIYIVEDVALAVKRIDVFDRKQRVDLGRGLARPRGNGGGAGADIDLLDLRAGASVLDGAVEQHTALVHDRDVVGELEYAVDVVLNQQHRHVARDALDDGADPLALG